MQTAIRFTLLTSELRLNVESIIQLNVLFLRNVRLALITALKFEFFLINILPGAYGALFVKKKGCRAEILQSCMFKDIRRS